MGSIAQAASTHDTSTGFVLVLPSRLLRRRRWKRSHPQVRAVTITAGGHLDSLAMPLHSTNSTTLESVRPNPLRDNGLYNGGVPLAAGTAGDSPGDGVADAAMSLVFASSSSFFSSG
jgi:hypothetical protein